jgi:hypothetical protein
MKENLENIDLLINDNMDRQLSTVDWNQLYGRIQTRLDEARKQTRPVFIKRAVFRGAVGISSAAAVLLVVFVLMGKKEQPLLLNPGQRAAVQFTQCRTIAKTEIAKQADTSTVSVTMEPAAKKTQVTFSQPNLQVAQCEVTIVDQNGPIEKENTPRPSWIIMRVSKPETSSSKVDQNQWDIVCLF